MQTSDVDDFSLLTLELINLLNHLTLWDSISLYHFLSHYEIYTIKLVIRIKLSHIYDKILYLHYGNTVKTRIYTRGIQVSRETDNNSTDRPKASREELCPVGSQKRTLIEFSK